MPCDDLLEVLDIRMHDCTISEKNVVIALNRRWTGLTLSCWRGRSQLDKRMLSQLELCMTFDSSIWEECESVAKSWLSLSAMEWLCG